MLTTTDTPNPPAPTTARAWTAAMWAAFAALALGQLLVDVDDVVLNIALPTIATDLGLGDSVLPWVVNSYVLCFGGLLLLGGRLADRFGHRTVLLVGVSTFVVASLSGAVASSATGLVVARAGQGIAAALLAPAAMSLLVRTFSGPGERTRALGLWGAVTGAGSVVGLVVGGVVTERWGWDWIFAGNAAAAALVGLSVVALLPGGTGDPGVRIEPVGALAVTGGIVLLVDALHGTVDHGLFSWQTLGLLAAAGAALTAAALAGRRGGAPLVPSELLRDRAVVVSDACAALTGAALLGTFYFVSLHVQQVQGYTPTQAAWSYLPLVLGLVVAAGAGSSLVPRYGARPVLATGMATCAAGLALLALLGIDSEPVPFRTGLLPGLLVIGLGLGLAFVALTVTAIPGGEDTTDGGVASGLYNTALQLGGAVGIAVLATVATARADTLGSAGGSHPAAIAGGRELALLVAAGLLLVGVLVALLLPVGAGAHNEDHGPDPA